MSCREIGKYIETLQEHEQEEKKAKFRDSATLLDGFFTQLRVYFTAKNSQVLTPRDLYPKLYAKAKSAAATDIPPERKQKIITDTWKAFLGI